jgi:hypothetical protein
MRRLILVDINADDDPSSCGDCYAIRPVLGDTPWDCCDIFVDMVAMPAGAPTKRLKACRDAEQPPTREGDE